MHVVKAVEMGKPEMCVKGPSVLSLIPGFDVATGFVPDYMHAVLLGVTKQFLTDIWLNSSNHKCNFYLGKSRNQ